MPRTMWSGAISFGLVNVPVRLTSAVARKDVHFHQLHKADGARIELRRVCTSCGEELGWDDLARGYELMPGQHVLVTREELEALDPEATRTIDIEDFVDGAQVDPLYYQHAYYLLPDKKPAEKPYALLLEALKRTGKVGVARFVMRSKQYLALIRPRDDALVMSTMLYADEVVPVERLDRPPAEHDLPKRELEMAEQLVEQLSADFEPERYRDTYREQVLAMVERKATGEAIVVQPAPEAKAPVVDLVAALEASLEEAKQRSA